MENSKLILHLCHIHKLSNLINRTHILIHLIAPALLFYYRASFFFQHPKTKATTLPWLLVFASEVLLAFEWLLIQSLRWRLNMVSEPPGLRCGFWWFHFLVIFQASAIVLGLIFLGYELRFYISMNLTHASASSEQSKISKKPKLSRNALILRLQFENKIATRLKQDTYFIEKSSLCLVSESSKKVKSSPHGQVSETNLEELQEFSNSANEKLVSLDLIYGFPAFDGVAQDFMGNCKTFSRTVFPERLPEDDKLLPIDMFICTADPEKEPTGGGVMNMVLSAMAMDYPPEKLHMYLSDDAGADVILNGMREAGRFAK
ncbi:hypothetical protein ACFX2H_022077 [Malus domestica]